MTGTARAQPASSPADSKEALLEAAQAAVQDVRQKDTTRRTADRHGSRVVLLVASGVLFALSTYLLAERPSWFFDPPPATESTGEQEASTRLMLVREAERVRAYVDTHGTLPRTLAEAGTQLLGVGYVRRADGTFTLSASAGERLIELHSTDSVAWFLGASLETIQQRVGQ